jgi:hypothetical protein
VHAGTHEVAMAYDPGLVERLRDALARLGERGSRERGVFGGWGFLQGKSTFVIAYGDEIIAKMPPDGYAAALARPGVIAFAPDGERPMGSWVVVSADAIADDPELAEWVALALQGVRSVSAPKGAVRAKAATRSKGAPRSKGATRSKGAPRSKGATRSKAAAPSKAKAGRTSPPRRKPGGRAR